MLNRKQWRSNQKQDRDQAEKTPDHSGSGGALIVLVLIGLGVTYLPVIIAATVAALTVAAHFLLGAIGILFGLAISITVAVWCFKLLYWLIKNGAKLIYYVSHSSIVFVFNRTKKGMHHPKTYLNFRDFFKKPPQKTKEPKKKRHTATEANDGEEIEADNGHPSEADDREQEDLREPETDRQTSLPLNPYKELGVKKNASSNEIKAAYHSLMQQYHPDRVSGLGPDLVKLAELKSKRINEAYQKIKRKAA